VAQSRDRGYPGGMTRTLLSFGHGYSARALAARLLPEGWRVIGTTRSPEKAAEIAYTPPTAKPAAPAAATSPPPPAPKPLPK